MIQTTLLNYFNCNNINESLQYKSPLSLKQTNLTQYFKAIPKKKNLILNYFKPKVVKEKKEDNVFDIVLIDINSTTQTDTVKCIKRNMYDLDLKYITISYRWGEEKEQLVKTPDYTAHITSFDLFDLIHLCKTIQMETELKEIPYLWVDAISVNQYDHAKKKETILKMNQIYKKASYILAVPDFHLQYLYKNIANNDALDWIQKYNKIIHRDIANSTMKSINNNNNNNNTDHSLIQNEEEVSEEEVNEYELRKAYQFLAYLIDDWSNRVWVISEYQIAKEKYLNHGTPLKYIFLSLFYGKYYEFNRFFSYTFIDQHDDNDEDSVTAIKNVDNGSKFVSFLKSRIVQRPPLDMIMTSNATRNEDRLYAILPSWNEYKHLIKDIPNWNITDMKSIKLKLHDILKRDDLWNKARLLLYSSIHDGPFILPSFVSHSYGLVLGEIDYIDYTHQDLLDCLSGTKINMNRKYNNDLKEYIKDYHNKYGSIWKQNLIDIQFNKHQQQCYLSIKAKQVYVFDKGPNLNQEELLELSLGENDDLCLIYIPNFTYTIPQLKQLFPINSRSFPNLSGTLLLGNMDMNRWVLYSLWQCHIYGKPTLIYLNDYTFYIY